MWMTCNKCGKKVNVKKDWKHDICYDCLADIEKIVPLDSENVEESAVLAHENVEETYIVKKNCWFDNNHFERGQVVKGEFEEFFFVNGILEEVR